MDETKRKKIARGVLRSHMKTIEGNINGLLSGDALSEEEVLELKSLKKKFEDKQEKLSARTVSGPVIE